MKKSTIKINNQIYYKNESDSGKQLFFVYKKSVFIIIRISECTNINEKLHYVFANCTFINVAISS